MVLRGTQIQRRSEAKSSLALTQSLPHDLAKVYDRTGPLTSTVLGGVADLYLDELGTWTDSHGRKSFPATRAQCRVARLPRNQSPDAERIVYVPGHYPDCPDAIHLDRRDVGYVQ
jgi:hypothetical protein